MSELRPSQVERLDKILQKKKVVEFVVPGIESAIAELNRRYLDPAIEAAFPAPTDPLVGREVTLPNGTRGKVRERALDDSNLLFVSLPDGSEKVFSSWELSLVEENLMSETQPAQGLTSQQTGNAL